MTETQQGLDVAERTLTAALWQWQHRGADNDRQLGQQLAAAVEGLLGALVADRVEAATWDREADPASRTVRQLVTTSTAWQGMLE